MGNAVAKDFTGDDGRGPISEGAPNVINLKPYFDTSAYLTPHSDIVALMTLEHQTQMVNLMIRVGWEARMAVAENNAINKSLGEPEQQVRPSTQHLIDAAVEEMLEYLLFSDEAQLTSPIEGTSGFREEFSKEGRRDAGGRSLREFDLKTRMFRYPCSFMIYSDAFDGMPAIVKTQLYGRLFQVLSGQDDGTKFTHVNQEDRRAILGIIRETKKGLPAYWL